jgi:hypothetical protein
MVGSKKFYLEGNIGALKSTCLGELVQEINRRGFASAFPLPEPVEQWEREGQLRAFYSGTISPKDFQTYVNQTKAAACDRVDGKYHILLIERSESWNNRVFAAANTDSSSFSEEELDGDFHILLKTDPAKCLLRRQGRGRGSENRVGIEYLTRLSKAYSSIETEYSSNASRLYTADIDAFTDENGRLPKPAFERLVSAMVDFIMSAVNRAPV